MVSVGHILPLSAVTACRSCGSDKLFPVLDLGVTPLADRLVVLNGGRIEQIGTPEELYKTPASSFVAGFIGRPQINLLEDGPGVTVGIRPEDLRFDAQGMPCRIISREWQGSSQLLLLDSPRGVMRMLCAGDAAWNEPIGVRWSKAAEHRFDTSSGQRLQA